MEPAMNLKETDEDFEIEPATPSFEKKILRLPLTTGCHNTSAKIDFTGRKGRCQFRREFSYHSFKAGHNLTNIIFNKQKRWYLGIN